MSLLFFDGFDGYDAPADMTQAGGWSFINGSPFGFISSSVRVGTGKCVQMTTGGSFRTLLSADQAGNTLFLGIAFKTDDGTAQTFFVIYNSALQIQCLLNLGADRILRAYNGGINVILATGTHPIAVGGWYYIECKIKVANSGGIFDCKINGITDFTFTGDTQYQATDSVLYVGHTGGNGSTASPAYFDDVYILNQLGAINNTYLGEQRAELIYPTSDSSVQFSHNTGASNFAAVDDIVGAPDDNTTYVSSSIVGNKDEYGLTNLANVNVVAGVRLLTRAMKDDANPRTLKTGIKSGATDQQIEHILSTGTYTNFIDLFETSDGAGTAFTSTTIDSLLSTIEVAS